MREEEKEIDEKLYEILGYEKCSEADQAIEKIKDLLSSQLKEVLEKIKKHKDSFLELYDNPSPRRISDTILDDLITDITNEIKNENKNQIL